MCSRPNKKLKRRLARNEVLAEFVAFTSDPEVRTVLDPRIPESAYKNFPMFVTTPKGSE